MEASLFIGFSHHPDDKKCSSRWFLFKSPVKLVDQDANEAETKGFCCLPEKPALFVPENKEDILRLLRETGESRVYREIILNNETFAEDISLNKELRVVRIYTRNITERKRAEEQLKHFNEELESQVRSRTVELERLNILLRDEAIQRTQAEESVRKSLKEREFLLREVHHRVGNNLQIMLSLIRLQSRNIKDPGLLDTMGDFQNRIRAMAFVHQRMYRAEDISRIDLSEICTFLGTSLFKSYKVDPQHIRLNVEMKDLQVSIDYAIPISLIINELISNSIKHAFPKGTTGEITIAGRREVDTLVLSIRDTGIGIPEELDWMRSKQSIGHRLVVILVEQLNGTIKLDRTTGTAFNIVVKEKP